MVKVPKTLRKEWELKLRAEGLGLIDEVASKRTEESRVWRATSGKQEGYKAHKSWQIYDSKDMWCKYYWKLCSENDSSDMDKVMSWLLGEGWTKSQIQGVLRVSKRGIETFKRVHGPKATALLVEDYDESLSDEDGGYESSMFFDKNNS